MAQFRFHTTSDEVVSTFADRIKNKTCTLAYLKERDTY
jgi:hypothetical protein